MTRPALPAVLALSLFLAAAPALAASGTVRDAKSPNAAEAPKPENGADLPAMSPDRTVKQTARIGGAVVAYDATVGHIDVRDDKGKVIGQVVYTAYTVPGRGNRPVTFAFNGGPGAASVYLNLGAIGPKHVQFGAEGDAPSDSPVAEDNPQSWLDFTDLVFIDPIGTGFSRSMVDDDQTKKAFYGADPDIHYLSKVVYDWLVKAGRMQSPKYLVGESYGGYRVPRLAYWLQTQLGVGLKGLVMVSPYLDPAAIGDADALSPLQWMINLPSMAAGNQDRHGSIDPAKMAEVEAYARGEYALDLLRGRSDPAAEQRMVAKVAGYTGLDPAIVQKLDARIDIGTYLREVHRTDRKIGSVYDSNVTAYDPFPSSADRQSGDPILEALIAPTTSAMVDFVTRTVGWKTEARYNALSFEVNEKWDRGTPDDKPVSDLRKAVANDPKMRVMIAHGWDDLSCPFFASRLLIDQMPAFGQAERIRLAVYPGGHMFYSRPASAARFKADARAVFGS